MFFPHLNQSIFFIHVLVFSTIDQGRRHRGEIAQFKNVEKKGEGNRGKVREALGEKEEIKINMCFIDLKTGF